MSDDKNNLNKMIRGSAPYFNLGMELAVTICIMVFIGYYIDTKFETKPTFLIIFAFLGSIGAIYNFIKTTLKNDSKRKNEKNISDK